MISKQLIEIKPMLEIAIATRVASCFKFWSQRKDYQRPKYGPFCMVLVYGPYNIAHIIWSVLYVPYGTYDIGNIICIQPDKSISLIKIDL